MEKINKLSLLKGIAELVVTAGVGAVVGNLVKATTPYDIGRVQKIMVGIGGYSMGAVLGDLSAKHINGEIDKYAERFNSIFNPPISVEETEAVGKEFVEDVLAGKNDETIVVTHKATGGTAKISKAELDEGLTNDDLEKLTRPDSDK